MENKTKVAAPSNYEQSNRNRNQKYLAQCVTEAYELTYHTIVYAFIGSSEVAGVMNMLGTFHAVCHRIHHLVVPM